MDVTGTKQEGREWQPERLRPQWGDGGRKRGRKGERELVQGRTKGENENCGFCIL